MDSQSSNLPVEVVELILSFLPVRNVCKMRVVCKVWNELTNNATFHALCNKNGKKEDYLFLWRNDNIIATTRRIVTPSFVESFHFFDLDMEKWYSIPSTEFPRFCSCDPNRALELWFLGMDNGLVCNAIPFQGAEERNLSLSLLDLVAQTRRDLPTPHLTFLPPHCNDTDSFLVTVVDQVTHSYKVFFLNIWKGLPLVYVYESGTKEWRPIGGLPHLSDDAIAFQSTVFASQSTGALFQPLFQFSLFRYQLEGDSFAKVWQMNFQRKVVYSKLIVRHNRLFVLVITALPRAILLSDSEDESESQSCFQTCQDEEGPLFEMYEILLDEGSSKQVVQFTRKALEDAFGDHICANLWLGFPCFDSKGGYSSVVLIHHHSGEMRRFHLATGAVDVVPACPLARSIPHKEGVAFTFEAKTMKLSLRDVLKQSATTSSSVGEDLDL